MDKAISRNGRRGWLIPAVLLACAALAGAVGQYAAAGAVSLVALLALAILRTAGRRRRAADGARADTPDAGSSDGPHEAGVAPVGPDGDAARESHAEGDVAPEAALAGSLDVAPGDAPAPEAAPVSDDTRSQTAASVGDVPAEMADPEPDVRSAIPPSRASFLSFNPDDPGPETADLHPLDPSGFDWSLAPPHGEQAGPDLRRLIAAAEGSAGAAVWDIKTYGSTESVQDWRGNRRPGQHDSAPTYVTRRTGAAEDAEGDPAYEAETVTPDEVDAGAEVTASETQGEDAGATAAAITAEADRPDVSDPQTDPADASGQDKADGRDEAPKSDGPDPVDAFLAAIAAKAGLAGAAESQGADAIPDAEPGDAAAPKAAAAPGEGDDDTMDFRSAVAALMAIRGPAAGSADGDAPAGGEPEDGALVAGETPDRPDEVADPLTVLDTVANSGPDADPDRPAIDLTSELDGTLADAGDVPEGAPRTDVALADETDPAIEETPVPGDAAAEAGAETGAGETRSDPAAADADLAASDRPEQAAVIEAGDGPEAPVAALADGADAEAEFLRGEAAADRADEPAAEEPMHEAPDGDADLRPLDTVSGRFSELAAAAAAGRLAARAKVDRRAGPSFGALLAARRAELKAHPHGKAAPPQDE
jgi:hypothetical protein